MASSIVEKILGNNSLLTNTYLDSTLMFTKSLLIVIRTEGGLYNDLLKQKYGLNVDTAKKETWRYYMHLAGKYHSVDVPIKMISWDNGKEIVLDRTSVEKHKTTRKELLKFGSFYRTIVDAYPEQELLLKSLISTSKKLTIEEIVKLRNHSIVAYDASHIEVQESNLLPRLQERINNYAITKTLPYYSIAESLYMASMYIVLYQFIYMNILNLRLANAKTSQAHSYHILSYLASHHRLDKNYPYLDIKQTLFLYRNLKYLNTYAGTNEVFYKLIDKFFTVRRVSVINYIYKQKNSISPDGSMEYRFNQKLLNDANLVFETKNYDLEEIAEKEEIVLETNKKEYEFHTEEIDFKNRNSLHAELATKDLEISIIDNGNDIKYSMLTLITDYWAQTLSLGINSYIVNFTDPIKGQRLVLDTADAFKLYTIALHRTANITLDVIPDYHAVRVLRPDRPSVEELVSKNFRKSSYLTSIIEDIHFNTPEYPFVDTPSSFNEFVFDMYRYNLGSWLYLSSLGDKDMNAQVSLAMENLHYSTLYKQDGETVTDFLRRIEFPELNTYNEEQALIVVKDLIKNVSEDLSNRLERNKFIQETLVEVLSKFKSYSTQLVSRYTATDSILTNLGFPYSTLGVSASDKLFYVPAPAVTAEIFSKNKSQVKVTVSTDFSATSSYHDVIDIDIEGESNFDGGVCNKIVINLSVPGCLIDDNVDWVVNPSSQEHLFFLSTNV